MVLLLLLLLALSFLLTTLLFDVAIFHMFRWCAGMRVKLIARSPPDFDLTLLVRVRCRGGNMAPLGADLEVILGCPMLSSTP